MQKQKEKSKPSAFRRLRLIWLLFLIPSFCFCLTLPFNVDDIYGTSIEFLTHYPNSELIWSGYGVYGSGDYGSKDYVRWTADDIAIVQAYYKQLPEEQQAQLMNAAGLDYRDLWVCNWVGFSREDCDTVKNNLPNYGTVIIFSHRIWAG